MRAQGGVHNGKKLDKRQEELLEKMQNIAHNIAPKGFIAKIKHIFGGDYSNQYSRKYLLSNHKHSGIYLHGGVGRGKTMLMRMFFDSVSVPKEIIHFQKFMQNVHLQLHKLQGKSKDSLVQNLALDIAKRSQIICMDEFEIKDIADAMIIMVLFQYLLKYNVFIFLTTNTLPDNLYKDGMQRESFLPFIDMIKHKFDIMYLDTDTDYRYNNNLAIKNKILYPASLITHNIIQNIAQELIGEEKFSQVNVKSFGRTLHFSKGNKNTLITDFAELFERSIGYGDYVAINERFKIIIVEKVRKILENETDILTRFINFIDNAYFNKVILFMELECEPELIYSAGHKKPEFKRTVSRLIEMNSNEYL